MRVCVNMQTRSGATHARLDSPRLVSPAVPIAAALLGAALALSHWRASPWGYLCGAAAALCLVDAIVRRTLAAAGEARGHQFVSAGAVALGFVWLWIDAGNRIVPTTVFGPLLAAAAALALAGVTSDISARPWWPASMLAVFLTIGVWTIAAAPPPPIDVWVWHHEALEALFSGINPFGMTMPNIYPDGRNYAPEFLDGQRVLVGYHYPPLSLLLAVPGYLAGDYRYSLLVATTIAGVLLYAGSPTWRGAAAMSLWLFSPVTFFVIEWGWTDPFVVLFLVATGLAAQRRSAWTFLPLGLLFAVKQYAVLAAPLLMLLPARDESLRGRLRLLLQAAAVALVVSVPFLIWDPAAMFRNLVTFQAQQPFRPESLSVPAWWYSAIGGMRLPSWLCFAAVAPATALALWRLRPSATSFALAVSLVLFVFFACAKQAFVNYYVVCLGALAAVIAFSGPGSRVVAERDGRTEPRGAMRRGHARQRGDDDQRRAGGGERTGVGGFDAVQERRRRPRRQHR